MTLVPIQYGALQEIARPVAPVLDLREKTREMYVARRDEVQTSLELVVPARQRSACYPCEPNDAQGSAYGDSNFTRVLCEHYIFLNLPDLSQDYFLRRLVLKMTPEYKAVKEASVTHLGGGGLWCVRCTEMKGQANRMQGDQFHHIHCSRECNA